MRALWAIRPVLYLADVVVLRCTALGPRGPYPVRGRGGGHSFAAAVAMPTFSLLVVTLVVAPANRQALARFAVRCGLTHVPVQLSQVQRLSRGQPEPPLDPRNFWATVANLVSPAPSGAESSADGFGRRVTESESVSAPDGGAPRSRGASTAKLSQGHAWAAEEQTPASIASEHTAKLSQGQPWVMEDPTLPSVVSHNTAEPHSSATPTDPTAPAAAPPRAPTSARASSSADALVGRRRTGRPSSAPP